MYCPKCGAQNNDEVKFCSSCGQAFERGQNPLPPTPQIPSAAPVAEKQWWGKWWGILILVLLTGPLGAAALYFTWKSKLSSPVKWGLTVVIVLAMWYLQAMLLGDGSSQNTQ